MIQIQTLSSLLCILSTIYVIDAHSNQLQFTSSNRLHHELHFHSHTLQEKSHNGDEPSNSISYKSNKSASMKSTKSRKSSKSSKSSKSEKEVIIPIVPCLTESVRNADIISVVSEISGVISRGSPEEMALTWILYQDLNTNACDGSLMIRERYILALLYFYTNGASWSNKTNWLSSLNHCSWRGILCGSGPVDGIILNENNLDGILPKELSYLTSLRTFRVFQNKLYGEIPYEMYSLPLTFFDVEANTFRGNPFPLSAFAAVNTLEKLRISQNSFMPYNIPSYIGEMTQLEQLWIVDSNAIGSIPSEMNQLTNLVHFLAKDNNISGEIPSLDNLLNLDRILLENNQLSSTIPSVLGSLTNLKLLKLANNTLVGSVPRSFSNLDSIEELDLSNNTLTGVLPDLSDWFSLKTFVISQNAFEGQIPDFGSSSNLTFVDLSHNSFTGTLPSSFFTLLSLSYFYLNDNMISGTIPDNYGDAVSLIDLYLNNNRLSGTIPGIEVGDLPSITELLLNFNLLDGPVPMSLCNGIEWESLHADCYPAPGEDLPRNECPSTCCTTCFPLPSSKNKVSIMDRLKNIYSVVVSPGVWKSKEWVIFSFTIMGTIILIVCIVRFCCSGRSKKKKIEKMRQERMNKREMMREKHLEDYCEAIKEKMRQRNVELKGTHQSWDIETDCSNLDEELSEIQL